jgi:hypothetical protein
MTVPRLPGTLLLAACGLASCAQQTETVTFRSAAERDCHARAAAAIRDPGVTLRRQGQDGPFVEVTFRNGFLIDTRPSETFDACMGSGQVAAGDVPVSMEGPPIIFTPAEQAEWARLPDAQRVEALRFIRQGGTLSAWLARG